MAQEYYRREVKRGYWYHDGVAKKGVVVEVLNYDYWLNEEKYAGLEVTDKTPALNEQGEMYLLTWYDDLNYRKQLDYPLSGLSIDEVVHEAELMIRQKIAWLAQ